MDANEIIRLILLRAVRANIMYPSDAKQILDMIHKEEELNEVIETWKERLCADESCPNIRHEGFVYCSNCLHESPNRAPEHVLIAFKRGPYYRKDE